MPSPVQVVLSTRARVKNRTTRARVTRDTDRPREGGEPRAEALVHARRAGPGRHGTQGPVG